MAHEGHRQRMIKKLENGTLTETEVLEVMLYPLLPRKDTGGIAHRLISEFGSIIGVFSADEESLCRIEGVGGQLAKNLRLLGCVFVQCANPPYRKYDGKFDSKAYATYARDAYIELPYEVMDLLLLNQKCAVYRQFRLTDYHGHEVRSPLSQLTDCVLREKPFGVVLAHNHPFSTAQPSAHDDETTRTVQIFCSLHGFAFCDHLIFSPESETFSYYESGRMAGINQDYAVKSLTKQE